MRSVMGQKVGGAERLGIFCADFEMDGYPYGDSGSLPILGAPPEASVPHRPHEYDHLWRRVGQGRRSRSLERSGNP